MMRKRKETTAERVIIDNEVISVATLKKKASRANAVFWVACLLVAMLSGLVVPYLSMASLAVNNSDAFTGTIIPGYSMGGIEVGAYGVDINKWGLVSNPTFTGSTYGIWSGNRYDKARGNFNQAHISEYQSSSVSASTKASVWEAVTGRNSFSSAAPNGTVDTPDSAQYDTVTPYRTSEETTYFMSSKPSVSADQDVIVTLYPDFVILSVDENEQVHVLNNPDDATVSSTGSVLSRDENGNVSKTTAIPVYVPLSAIFDAYGFSDVTTDDGELVSLDQLMKAIGEDAKANGGVAQKLTDLVNDSGVNLLGNTEYSDINGGTGETSDAFNPYPYSMVFQQADDAGRLVTSSIYSNSEAYVYFSPNSMYQAYIALKTEADRIVSQATQEIANNDSVTAFQLGYYYAAMAICEAYLTEALPQDMTRGYVGASEDTAPNVQGDVAGTASVSLESVFDTTPSQPQDFSRVTYATLMYDVAHQLSGGDEYCLGNTNAIMNTLSVFGYDNKTENPGVGVMKGMDATTTYRRLTAFTPYEQSSGDFSGDDKGSQLEPDTLTSYTSGMYNAPYYPIQQHLMPDSEESYRFSITSVIPYNTVTECIAYNGLGSDKSGTYEIQTKLSYSSNFTQEFQSVTQYMTKAKALADQYDASNDDDSSTEALQKYEAETTTDATTGRQVLVMGNSSQEEGMEQSQQQAMQARVDSALMAYQSSTMDSDNVHDLCDVIRSVPGIKYETFMRFYNPLKSDGGDTDFFLTRVSPAMTDYFPVILNRGYENAGGIQGKLGTSGVACDYFSIPSFAPCFASHTASTTFYGALNYELRAFYKKGFLETLSDSTNVQVPQLEDFQAAQDMLNEMNEKEKEQEPVTKANIISLFVLAKRVILADVIETAVAAENHDASFPLSILNDDPSLGGDENNVPYEALTKWIKKAESHDTSDGEHIEVEQGSSVQEQGLKDIVKEKLEQDGTFDKWVKNENLGSATLDLSEMFNDDANGVIHEITGGTGAVTWIGWSILNGAYSGERTADGLADFLIAKYESYKSKQSDEESDRKPITFSDSDVLADVLRGKTDTLGGDALAIAQEIKDQKVNDFSAYFGAVISPGNNPGDWIAGTTPFATAAGNDSYSTYNYAPWSKDGSNNIAWLITGDGTELNFNIDSQLLYNIYYTSNVKSKLISTDGKYYWDDPQDIKAYGANPTGLDEYYHRNGHDETKELYTVAYAIGFDVNLLNSAMDTREKYEEQIAELSQEIFKDVINLKQDMKLITDSMPSQMQNVLAWADYQNSSDSENQYRADPSEANVTVNVGVETNVETGDSAGTILSQSDLADYGYSWDPNGGSDGNGALVNDAGIGGTNDAINEMNSRMGRGVAGATWTSTIQPAYYTMTEITGRITEMNTDSDQNYPYYGIVNGRLQSGTDQYALLQAHVIDYSSIASGIAGDLATRQRGQLVKIQDPDVGLFADIADMLNNIAGIFTELGLSLIRFTGGLFEDLMFTSQMQEQIADVKSIENSSEIAESFDLTRATTPSKTYSTLSAACTSSYVNMNRTPATLVTFDTSTGELTSASMSTASAASTQIEAVGANALLRQGYGLYSIIQSIALALVMVFLLVIAFQNFVSYSAGGEKEFIIAQTRLKVVLPRTIAAIFMIGLPPLGSGGIGFQGGCYLALQFLSSVINTISSTFVTLSGGGMVDAWVSMVESMGTMDFGTLLVWLICALIISCCFLIGCAVILIQSLILLCFWIIGPLVWAFYAWPYGADPQRKTEQRPNGSHDHIGTMMWNITQKLHVGVFSRGAVGNAAPTAWAWSYVLTASLTIVWSLMFWAMSLAVSTVDGGASATGTAAVIGTGYDAASSSVANAALFSLNELGLSPWLQILLLTIMCVLIFWLMTRMMMNLFKNVPLSAAGLVPYITGGIRHGLGQLGQLSVRGGSALANAFANNAIGTDPGSSAAKRRVGNMMRTVGNGMHTVGGWGHEGVRNARALGEFVSDRAEDIAASPLGRLAHSMAQGGVADADRMSLSDAADAMLMRRINHNLRENAENADAVAALASMQGMDKQRIDNALDKMDPDRRRRLQQLGVLRQDDNGEYVIDWDANDRLARSLNDNGRNLEQQKNQLQQHNKNLADNARKTARTNAISSFVDADEFVPRVSERMHDEYQRWREADADWNEDSRIAMLTEGISRDARDRVNALVAAQSNRIDRSRAHTADEVAVASQNFSRALNAMTDLLPADISDRDANRIQSNMIKAMANANSIRMLTQEQYDDCAARVARGESLNGDEAASFSFMLAASGTLSSTDKRIERQSENVQALMAAKPVAATDSGRRINAAQRMRSNYDAAQTAIQNEFMSLHAAELEALVTTSGETADEMRRIIATSNAYADIDGALENMIRTGNYNGDEVQGVLDGLHNRMREFQDDRTVVDPILSAYDLNHNQFVNYNANQASDDLVNEIAINNAVAAAMEAGQTVYQNVDGVTVKASAAEIEKAITYMRDHAEDRGALERRITSTENRVARFNEEIENAPDHSDLKVAYEYYEENCTDNKDRLSAVLSALGELDKKLSDGLQLTKKEKIRRNTLRKLRDGYQDIESNERLVDDKNMISLLSAHESQWRSESPDAFEQQTIRSRDAERRNDEPRGNRRRDESSIRRNGAGGAAKRPRPRQMQNGGTGGTGRRQIPNRTSGR